MLKLAATLLLLSTLPAMAAPLPPDLAAAVRNYDVAQFRNDTETLGGLVRDDFVLVNSNGSLENKQQFLADYHLPGFHIAPYVWREPVQKFWGDGAVVGGLIHLHWTQDGKPQTRSLRIAYVWTKRGGRWQAIYAQVTRAS